ncbi:MAG: diguanylate cyclase [Gemmataceae bacterium]|nr:diguanylate cyclase [Gemmataceae bacterium]
MSEPLAPKDGPARQLLLVEDDRLLARVVERVLARFGARVVLASKGAEALTLARDTAFHAVAVDITLPDMSGVDVIRRLRASCPTTGVVAITGFVDVDVAVRAMKAGADDFLAKPFDAELLWHVLNKAAESRNRHIEAEQARLYRQLAYTDALTGCPNRRFIDEFIVRAVDHSRTRVDPLAVAYLDVDNVKLLNDFVGHQEGDRLLCRVADALADLVQPPAVFGRFGGDEFVLVFPGATVQEARALLEEIRRAVAAVTVVNSARVLLPIRVSFGLAAFRGHESPRDLVAEAEEQMYLDKSLSPGLLTGLPVPDEIPGTPVAVPNLKALRTLVKAIDRRDSYTRFHSDHATQLALALARDLALPQAATNAIAVGGPIHDLGKIVVPDDVLRKPGPLTTEERKTMESHPAIGAAITAAITDYDAVVDVVRHHHERFDGAGYPAGLQQEQISLPTRLFTIADSYSAITTDRPYRRGLTPEQAVEELRVGAGTQFDPDLTRQFLAVLERQYGARAAAA